MLFVTILVDLTLARVNLDTQAMAKIALVSYFHLTRTQELLLSSKQEQQQYGEMSSDVLS